MAEAMALALIEVLPETEALRAAWDGGEPVSRTFRVHTCQGEMEVTLRAPCEPAHVEHSSSRDVLADLAALDQDGDEIDPEARERLGDELVRRFAASPEAKELSGIYACRFMMDLAAGYLGATIATLEPSELRKIIFELIPRKLSVGASEAQGIIEEIRAFYGFLKREHGLQQADACLRTLGGNAVSKLEAALSDGSNFGMAKSLFMAGREGGFDMESPEGIEAWMRSVQSMPLPPSVGPPFFGAPGPATRKRKAAKAAKDERKAARKVRKKNR